MKFLIVQDTANNWNTWTLATNAGATVATSSTPYTSIEEAEAAITSFKAWVSQAPTQIVTPPTQIKDWKHQAMEQLKKARHKG